MKRLIGILLILLGTLGGAWSAVVGGCFSAIFLLGYLGTGGKEVDGTQLVFLCCATVAGVVIGVCIARLGMWLRRPST